VLFGAACVASWWLDAFLLVKGNHSPTRPPPRVAHRCTPQEEGEEEEEEEEEGGEEEALQEEDLEMLRAKLTAWEDKYSHCSDVQRAWHARIDGTGARGLHGVQRDMGVTTCLKEFPAAVVRAALHSRIGFAQTAPPVAPPDEEVCRVVWRSLGCFMVVGCVPVCKG